ncbi:Component of oligomeric Golgi complex 8 [Aphelenchoides bicaudatus]|nr:Component of oligomeric Golgi complex 8 [Aphelenchoides bicaudatus]
MSLDHNLDSKIKSLEALDSFRELNLQELKEQQASLTAKISHLSNKISDLAFNNYRTYANAGRTAENCIEMFSNINHEMTSVRQRFPNLLEDIEKFDEFADNLFREFMRLDDASSDSSLVWEVLGLTKVMDDCIKAGHYDSAYSLTTFASNLQQSKLSESPIIKKVITTLIEARHGLLDVLFNKFAGQIPSISNLQLRVSLLQYRDVYLEKNVMVIMADPDYAVKIIDTYRDCMYDTIVLYLAVFPNVDSQKRYNSVDDPKWERWTNGSQTFLLQSWAHRNLDVMFERIRASEQRSPLDLETINGKLMSFAYSFGRLKMDFRPLIVNEISQITLESFSNRITKATETLIDCKQLNLLDDEIFETSKSDIEKRTRSSNEDATALSAPIELLVWDELCAFGNDGVIDSLNNLRHFISPIFLNDVYAILKLSFDAILEWISKFEGGTEAEAAKRAKLLMIDYFLPFMNRCFQAVFSYDSCFKPYFKSSLTYEQYLSQYNFIPVEFQPKIKEKVQEKADPIVETTLETNPVVEQTSNQLSEPVNETTAETSA